MQLISRLLRLFFFFSVFNWQREQSEEEAEGSEDADGATAALSKVLRVTCDSVDYATHHGARLISFPITAIKLNEIAGSRDEFLSTLRALS